MGAVTFSIDLRLVERLARALPLEVFVETGTFHGDSLAAVLPYVARAVSIEFSEAHWRSARERFAGDDRVEIVHGDSGEALARVRAGLGEACSLYWLDAHWCVADGTAGEHSQCPLLRELAAIRRLGETSVVLIDDARLFLAPPPEPHEVSHWPSFDSIVAALRRLAPGHELMVVNDVIAFYPRAASAAVASYAREFGVDWLRARQSLEENDALRSELDARQSVIARLVHESDALRSELDARQSVIGRLAQEIDALRSELDARQSVIARLAQAADELDAKQAQLLQSQSALEHAQAEPRRLQHELELKEAVIRELSTALDHYRAALPVMRPALSFVRRVRAMVRRLAWPFRALSAVRPALSFARWPRTAVRGLAWPLKPKLGVLYQHPPIEMRIPEGYAAAKPPDPAPRISLVTPTFRQAGFIEVTLESVLDQGYSNLEYRVQDGGSDDGTVAILERHAGRLSGWESRRDSGQSEAINRAFARTSGEIMGWLNSDDILLPGALAAIGDFFARHPDIDVVYGHRVLIDENGAEIGRWVMPPHDDEVLSWADFVPQETMFWRRRIWEKAGGRVDESFRFAMDWDLIVRFREAGARFARLPRFIGGFRIHPHQKTSAVINEVGFQEMNRIRERMLGRVPSPVEVRRAVAPYLARHLLTDLAWRARRRLGAAG